MILIYMFRFLKRFSDSSSNVSRGALRRFSALLVVLLFVTGLHSCRNPGDIVINSRTEIERFMSVNQDIRELFDPVIYAQDTFVLDSGDATFRVARIDTTILRDVRVTDDRTVVTTASGKGRLATASQTVRYSGTFTQRNSPFGAEITNFYDAEIVREALFQKLGTNDDPFLGWELIGLKLGKSLAFISQVVTITQFPLVGRFPKVISDVPQGVGLAPDGFTYFFHLQSVSAGDSIDIITKQGPMTVFARTNIGYRQLSGRPEAGGAYHYGFRTPPADPQNRFFHLLTFQKGPVVAIDSTSYNLFVSGVNVTPPDTQIGQFTIIDTILDSSFIYRDTCADTSITDTMLLDTCSSSQLVSIDSIPDTTIFRDTTITPAIFDTIYDSTLAPPDTGVVFEDLWAFPYSVR